MYTPIIISNPSPAQVERCPGCGKKEKKITICYHCSYEYVNEEQELDYPYWYISLLIDIGLLFLFFYILGKIPDLFVWYTLPTMLTVSLIFIMLGGFSWFALGKPKK